MDGHKKGLIDLEVPVLEPDLHGEVVLKARNVVEIHYRAAN